VRLELPFASRDEVRLSRTGGELTLHVGTWRRSLVLPRMLLTAQTKGAKMDGNTLTIRFEPPAKGKARTNRGGRQ
jgi:arsenite/tail-anchored protein-transporting ATPase